nr:Chain B, METABOTROPIC GLUTAMATE RECEPTOR MGLUR5 [synthetic construct]
TPPSPF